MQRGAKISVVGLLVLGACRGGESNDDELGSESSQGDADSSDADSSSEADSSDSSTDAGSDSGSDSGTDTGSEGLACPLADRADVASLTLAPSLFAEGADPSASPECAIVNPERGFHHFVDLRSLDADTLASAAAEGISLVYGQVLIGEYRDAPLDGAVLDEIAAGFDLVREHGMKVVPRFHYSDAIDEPDADLDRILGHIDQLAPILQANADVILLLQAGFIGAWGEWHSSQNGLDAPGPRKQILDALLAAMPETRTVGVRRPSFKQDAYAGPLTPDSAHEGSALARVGHVNDCFLASDDDEGTYQEPGEKDYAIADSAFVPVGGETCAVNPPRSECGSALDELALHHWTHLNADYHPDVLAAWQQDGCYAEIACRLGHRLALVDLRWAASGSPGGTLPVAFELFNDGFAAPANPRDVVLVFDGPTRFEIAAGLDLRTAQPGEAIGRCVDAPLPAELPSGSYRIGLRLADPEPTLADDPRQAIRLVEGEWSEGINWYDATFEVN
ncbi:DUF4832 domain-containing protein [Nannocystaceae bacterium ST9]